MADNNTFGQIGAQSLILTQRGLPREDRNLTNFYTGRPGIPAESMIQLRNLILKLIVIKD